MRKLGLYIFLLLMASSCVERIDVQLDTTYARLVVDGSISTDSTVKVNLTKTADYFYNAPIPRVTSAFVTITDGNLTVPLTETVPGKSGLYLADSSFHGKAGNTYTLNISLTEPLAGQKNYSASCYLAPVSKLDSISTFFHGDWGPEGVWEVKVYAQEPGNEVNYYMFNLYRNNKLWSDTISKVVVSDDAFFNGSYINGLGAFHINNKEKWATLYPGDSLMVEMSGITKEYYDYINEVKAAGFNIPFFMGPPANVVGNVNNGGIGFFNAYSSSYAKGIVKKIEK